MATKTNLGDITIGARNIKRGKADLYFKGVPVEQVAAFLQEMGTPSMSAAMQKMVEANQP